MVSSTMNLISGTLKKMWEGEYVFTVFQEYIIISYLTAYMDVHHPPPTPKKEKEKEKEEHLLHI